jgi:nitroreductase
MSTSYDPKDSTDHPGAKPAPTRHPVRPVIRDRWSPRAFADEPVDSADLDSILEAARWAASSFNEQPWRFVVATKDDSEAYERALGGLNEFNRKWASTAPVLILAFARKTFSKTGEANAHARYDLGQAVAHMALEATARDLFVHQMAGIRPDHIRETYDVPDEFEPVTGIALGHWGRPERIPEDMREGERAGRSRKSHDDIFFDGNWGEPRG